MSDGSFTKGRASDALRPVLYFSNVAGGASLVLSNLGDGDPLTYRVEASSGRSLAVDWRTAETVQEGTIEAGEVDHVNDLADAEGYRHYRLLVSGDGVQYVAAFALPTESDETETAPPEPEFPYTLSSNEDDQITVSGLDLDQFNYIELADTVSENSIIAMWRSDNPAIIVGDEENPGPTYAIPEVWTATEVTITWEGLGGQSVDQMSLLLLDADSNSLNSVQGIANRVTILPILA